MGSSQQSQHWRRGVPPFKISESLGGCVLDTRESSCLEHQAVGDREQPGPRVFFGREAVAMSPQAQEGLGGDVRRVVRGLAVLDQPGSELATSREERPL